MLLAYLFKMLLDKLTRLGSISWIPNLSMVSAVVNDKVVDSEYQLRNKDRVRIIKDVLSYGPREEWLDKVQTTKAKRKIKEFGKKQWIKWFI